LFTAQHIWIGEVANKGQQYLATTYANRLEVFRFSGIVECLTNYVEPTERAKSRNWCKNGARLT